MVDIAKQSDQLGRGWKKIRSAPYHFIGTIVFITLIIWGVFQFTYGHRIKIRDDRLAMRDDQIKTKDATIGHYKAIIEGLKGQGKIPEDIKTDFGLEAKKLRLGDPSVEQVFLVLTDGSIKTSLNVSDKPWVWEKEGQLSEQEKKTEGGYSCFARRRIHRQLCS